MMVLSYDLTSQQVVERLVTRHFTHTPRLTGGLANLRGVTSNHPIFDAATGRFKPAGDFLGGEVLLRLHGETTPVPLGAFSYDEMAPQPVYNLSVEETQTYFADGVLVHNKSDCDFCEPITGTGGRAVGGTGGIGTGGDTLVIPPDPDCAQGGQAGTSPFCFGGLGGIAGMGGKP